MILLLRPKLRPGASLFANLPYSSLFFLLFRSVRKHSSDTNKRIWGEGINVAVEGSSLPSVFFPPPLFPFPSIEKSRSRRSKLRR